PFTVRVNPSAPADALDGESELIEGVGGGLELPPPQAIRRKAIAITSELIMRFGTLRLPWPNDGLIFMAGSRATRLSEGAAENLRWPADPPTKLLRGSILRASVVSQMFLPVESLVAM